MVRDVKFGEGSMKKKKILIFIDWFLPGYKAGGPIQSISNFVNHFGAIVDISIVTSNKDLGATEPYENIESNVWIIRGNYRIKYVDKQYLNVSNYRFLLKEESYDSVYFNSLFSVYFTLLPLWFAVKYNMRVVLAPRGMLGAGALNLSKRKKQVVLWFLKMSGIPNKIIWQGTASTEILEIKKCFGEKMQVKLAANLSATMPKSLVLKQKEVATLNLFFLSRISEKKNLIGALHYLNQVKDCYQINFSIIGPIGAPAYWEECEVFIKKLPKHITVNYLGAIPNLELPEILKEQQVMLLPTFHENFGHVILEALQQGCPVILSDQTPWLDLEKKKIGYDIALDKPEDFIFAIESLAKMNEEDYQQWSWNAFNFATEFCNNKEIMEANRDLFV
jgi:glycosyltransferase involved in cell wall biosynthesis